MGNIIYHPEHGYKIERKGWLYRAICSCGWKGERRENNRQASGDLGEHLADIEINRLKSK